jgi:hypothetical protein
MVEVKSHFRGVIIYETLEASSRRLAPLHFFTAEKYLEDFNPSFLEEGRV